MFLCSANIKHGIHLTRDCNIPRLPCGQARPVSERSHGAAQAAAALLRVLPLLQERCRAATCALIGLLARPGTSPSCAASHAAP